MIVYLYHKQHGTHIAYDEGEVERCKRLGWTEKPPEKPTQDKTLHLPKRKDRK